MATIRRALTKVGGKPGFKEPKTTGSRRSIPLPKSLAGALVEHRRRQSAQALALGPIYDRDLDLVFASEIGTPLDHRNLVRRHFKPAVRAAKLPPALRLYDLRHTHATTLLAEGVNPKVVAERLGHSSVRMTLDTYSHVLPGMQEEATELIEVALFAGGGRRRPVRASRTRSRSRCWAVCQLVCELSRTGEYPSKPTPGK